MIKNIFKNTLNPQKYFLYHVAIITLNKNFPHLPISPSPHLPISPSPHLPTLPTLPVIMGIRPDLIFPIPDSRFPIPDLTLIN
ncbi:MAG: hypothetical protein F6K50_06010 [Moorea sp. SIO3I7]|nr:hypothetical protein [Moorena sp. SIO3I7]